MQEGARECEAGILRGDVRFGILWKLLYQLRLSVGCVVIEIDVEIVVVINCPYVVASHAV